MKKIYVKVPSNIVAGGAEALYQLVDSINNQNNICEILFDNHEEQIIPEKYKKYNTRVVSEIDDIPENSIIYPEIWTDQLQDYKNLKKYIWWLSVDNNEGKFKDFTDDKITHLCQSYYAAQFHIANGTEKYLHLFDYISEAYTKEGFDVKNKQDIIVFNPAKGIENTINIINNNPHLNFVPIRGMSERQIIDLLKISKIYIDFGHHPGKDRLPREAAILGNIVITNNKGSAKYYNDLPIPKYYKIDNISEINQKLISCFQNFDTHINDFDLYRRVIQLQKDEFTNQAKQLTI